MILYFLPATFVLALTSNALFNDSTTPNDDRVSWICIVIAAAIWPITLPQILHKQASRWFAKENHPLPLLNDAYEV